MEKKESIVICDAVRTPFGHGNKLKNFSPENLLAITFRALVERNKLDPEDISGVVSGCINQNTRAPNIGRIAGMLAGLPYSVNGYSIQANCNSGFTGLCTVIGLIAIGQGDLYLSGGVENMSEYGFRLRDKTGLFGSLTELQMLAAESGKDFLENFEIIDCLEEGLTDNFNHVGMIEIGEIMANFFGISRAEQDEYTHNNLQRAVDAVENDLLVDYIVPAGEITRDTYPLNRKRMLKKADSFSRAVPVFAGEEPEKEVEKFFNKHSAHLEKLGIKKIIPTVTMYNSSIPGNGAGACLVTTEEKAKELGLNPRVRITGWSMAGVDPIIMGIGPVESTFRLFLEPKTNRAGDVTMEDMDIIEIHEAFASQVLSVFRESEKKYGMKWDRDIINIHGGSLAYTHPLGATNMRLLTNVLTRFDENPSARYALACGCAGGGQGTSILFERF